MARRTLAPVSNLTERARTITAEKLNERLPVDNPDDEIGQLATVFNETLSRLNSSFEAAPLYGRCLTRTANAANRNA